MAFSGTELFPDSAAAVIPSHKSIIRSNGDNGVSRPAVETWLAFGEFIDPGWDFQTCAPFKKSHVCCRNSDGDVCACASNGSFAQDQI